MSEAVNKSDQARALDGAQGGERGVAQKASSRKTSNTSELLDCIQV
jgi:hypothetical protein